MHIFILADHVKTDPDRAVFYNVDQVHQYSKGGVRDYIPRPGRWAYFVNLLLTILVLRCTAWKKRPPGLIISDNPRIGFFVGGINRLTACRIPHVIWNFNILTEYRGLKRRLARFVLKRVHRIIVYSSHEAALYAPMFAIPADRVITTLYAGPYLDDPRYQALKGDHPGQDGIVSAGFSGRDYGFLSRVAAGLAEVPFTVLTYPAAVTGIEFPPNVEIVSGISELEYCRRIADAAIFFLPIKNKTTANGHIGMVQAMCFRTLLLTNRTAGTADYLRPDVNAVIYPDGDVDGTVDLIRQLRADPARRARIVDGAAQFARAHFTVRQAVDTVRRIADGIDAAAANPSESTP